MNYLQRLGAAATSAALEPRLPSRFEPDSAIHEEGFFEVSEEVAADHHRPPKEIQPPSPEIRPVPGITAAEVPDLPAAKTPPPPGLETEPPPRDRVSEPETTSADLPPTPPPTVIEHYTTEIVGNVTPAATPKSDPASTRDADPSATTEPPTPERVPPTEPEPATEPSPLAPPLLAPVGQQAPAWPGHASQPTGEALTDSTVVEVRIGQIDIRPPAPAEPATTPAAPAFEPFRTGPDLDDYLRGRI